MNHLRRLFFILLLSVAASICFKAYEIVAAKEKNQTYANFLCSTSKIDLQIGNYRQVSENIRTFLKKFELTKSSHIIKVGDTYYHQADEPQQNYQTYSCEVDGRQDINFKFNLQLPTFLDSYFYQTLLLVFTIVWLLSYVFFVFANKLQNIISMQILEQLRIELNLRDKNKLETSPSFWKIISKLVDFQNIKKDVTSLKEKIETQQNQITQAKVNEELMKKELAQNKEFSDKVDMFIHDIKSPLGLIGALQESSTDEKQKGYLLKAKKRLNGILGSLSNVRSEYNRKGLNSFQTRDTKQIVHDIILEKKTLHPNLRIEFLIPPKIQNVNNRTVGDKESLVRHFSNLVDNSIEAGATTINISLDLNSQFLIITFDDNGFGIPQEHLSKVFQKGFTSGKRKGSGLGLFALYEFIRKIDGKIEIDSRLKRGTKISISLPFQN